MEKVDWRAVGRAALAFFIQKILPMLLASGTVVAAYDQCVCKPAIQKAAAVAPK